MDCKQAASLMHDFLDDDLSKERSLELKSHLQICRDCQILFRELDQTDMMMFATVKHLSLSTSDELVDRIMCKLPTQRTQQTWLRWVKRHPALTAVAMFFLVMSISFITLWDSENQLIVKGSDLNSVVIEGDTVIVPKGKTIVGDLTVENGKAEIYGDIQGNLTIIDGSLLQASTAHISGQVKSIDQALDWIWYKITNTFTDVAYR